MDRRDLLKMLGAATLAGPLQLCAAEKDKPLYFSQAEFELLDHLTELIIPKDAHSGGAHEAGVATFIDRSVAEAFLPEEKEEWKNGLAEMDRLCHEREHKPFLKISKDKQIALLKKLAGKEEEPKSAGEKFFERLKSATVFAYYTSRVGIHDEMEYKGNVILQEFVGIEVS